MGFRDTRWRRVAPTQWRPQPVARPLSYTRDLVSLSCGDAYDNQDEMKHIANGDTSLLNQHYENKLLELKHEKKSLQSEIEMLRVNLSSISSTPRAGAQKPKEEYLQKLNVLEAKVT